MKTKSIEEIQSEVDEWSHDDLKLALDGELTRIYNCYLEVVMDKIIKDPENNTDLLPYIEEYVTHESSYVRDAVLLCISKITNQLPVSQIKLLLKEKEYQSSTVETIERWFHGKLDLTPILDELLSVLNTTDNSYVKMILNRLHLK